MKSTVSGVGNENNTGLYFFRFGHVNAAEKGDRGRRRAKSRTQEDSTLFGH